MSFDPANCLLGVVLVIDEMEYNGDRIGIIKVHLKSPEEQRLAKGLTVEFFETGFWEVLYPKDLKTLLVRHINYDEKNVLSHSFRAGLATTMAAMRYSG